jgi:hypothetical protein
MEKKAMFHRNNVWVENKYGKESHVPSEHRVGNRGNKPIIHVQTEYK